MCRLNRQRLPLLQCRQPGRAPSRSSGGPVGVFTKVFRAVVRSACTRIRADLVVRGILIYKRRSRCLQVRPLTLCRSLHRGRCSACCRSTGVHPTGNKNSCGSIRLPRWAAQEVMRLSLAINISVEPIKRLMRARISKLVTRDFFSCRITAVGLTLRYTT